MTLHDVLAAAQVGSDADTNPGTTGWWLVPIGGLAALALIIVVYLVSRREAEAHEKDRDRRDHR